MKHKLRSSACTEGRRMAGARALWVANGMKREQFGKPIANFPAVYEMLTNMKTKIDASRSLLYETSRYVDLYKIYEDIAKERQLSAEERAEMKSAQRNADMLTPMVKLFASEFANQVAYDSIQVHGGSGFMKEYKCERLYRDARILTIYEGTSQLQVVAAIRFVGKGTYLNLINYYDGLELNDNLLLLREKLRSMSNDFVKLYEIVSQYGTTSDIYNFHSRRLVEAVGYIIMGYLLLQDANRSDEFLNSCKRIIALGQAEIAKSMIYVSDFSEEDISLYSEIYRELTIN